MNPFETIVKPILQVLNYVLPVAISLVAALGMIWCIVLGVKLAKAEEPQDRDKAKGALKNAIIGFVLIFILLAVLAVATPALSTWMESYTNG